VEYFHLVFTLPHELNALTLCNKTVIFDLLFKVVSQTLEEFAADPKHGLNGRAGFSAILHTWDQMLLSHIHLHCVIPSGVLSFDGKRWTHSRKNFLFPVKALSKVFRGKFIDYLKKAFVKGMGMSVISMSNCNVQRMRLYVLSEIDNFLNTFLQFLG